MNIMQISSGRELNGAANSTLLLTRELARRGNRVYMVCLPSSWIGRQLASDSVEIIPSDLHRWPLDELRRIAAVVREKKIDVLHTHSSRAHFFGILLRWFCRVPCVATAHSCHFQLHWMLNDHVITVSEATRQYHVKRNFVRPNRIETIYNFIDYDRIPEVPHDSRSRIRAELGIDDSTSLIGTVGSVVPRKGALHLVRAMPEILAGAPDVRLAIIGNTSHAKYVSQVKSAADRLNVASSIIWTGERNDVLQLLAAMDLYVHPALIEPLPRSILEAMATRLPVVATTVGGVGECVSDQRTGLLVPPADSTSLAEAVLELLHDPSKRRQLGEAGRERVLKDFSVEGQVREIENALARTAKLRKAA